jgi:hypothetical protein
MHQSLHHPLSVPALARLLLKTHTEFATLLDRLPPGGRAPALPAFHLQLGSARLALDAGAGLELNCSQGPLEYRLLVDKFEAGKAPAMSARLTDRRTGAVHEFDGPAVFNGDIPPAFQDLHAEVTGHLRAFVPPALWQHLTAARGAAAAETADAGTAPAAGEGEAPAAPGAQAVQDTQGDTPSGTSGQAGAQAQEADEGMRTYVLARQGEPDLRFTGKLLDAVHTFPQNGRWTDYRVYQTRGGRFVGVKLGRSMRLGETDRVESQVADRLEDLRDFFGHNALAKLLTSRLGIRQFADIE